MLAKDMRDAIFRLERLEDETKCRFERDYKQERWFRDWDTMLESAQMSDVTNEDDASL